MKKLVYFAASVFIGVVSFCGCNTGYKPDAEYYFKTGDVYRVLELASETPEHKNDYGLESFIMPSNGNVVGTTVKLALFSGFPENALFFNQLNAVNSEGVKTIYDCLGIESVQYGEECFMCAYTGLYTYSIKMKYSASIELDIDLSEYNQRDLLGNIADVDIYTFNYKDLSVKDGSEVKSGSFKAIVIVGNQYIGRFSLNDQ